MEVAKTRQPIRVFVYGTLKPGGYYWNRFCEGKVTETVEAKVRGELYHLSLGYPAMARISQNNASWSRGYVLTLKNQNALDGFDYLEGYTAGRSPKENEYQRIQVEAFTLDGNSVGEVWTYVMSLENISRHDGVLIAHGNWSLP